MTILATSQSRKPHLLRRFSTRHGGARANTQLAPQFVHQSASFDAAGCAPSELIGHRNNIHQCAQSPPQSLNASSAAIKSP